MRLFNNALQSSWMGLLAAAIMGTSAVRALELDVEDGGEKPCPCRPPHHATVVNSKLKTLSKRLQSRLRPI